MARTLTNREIWNLQEEWLRAFAPRYGEATGVRAAPMAGAVFDGHYMAHFLRGAAAECEYGNATAREVAMIVDSGKTGMIVEHKPLMSEFSNYAEVIVFPTSFDWTFVAAEFCASLFTYRTWAITDGQS